VIGTLAKRDGDSGRWSPAEVVVTLPDPIGGVLTQTTLSWMRRATLLQRCGAVPEH